MKRLSPEISDFKKLDWSIGIFISFASLLFSALTGFTAYQYNEIDMLPFWERNANPNFLPHDFFTNASVHPNSRQVWGYSITFLSKLTGASWYSILYAVKLVFVSSVGSLYYLVLSKLYLRFIGTHIPYFKLLIGIFCALCVSNSYFVQFFTIAWWPPYIPDANAHNISILFGLLSVLWTGKPAGIILSCFSTALHPVMGLVFFSIQSLLLVSEKKYAVLLVAFCLSVVFPFLFHAIAFANNSTLSAKEFTDIYAWYRHPGHYIPSLFGKMGLSSLQVYVLNLVVLIGACWYSALNRKKNLLVISVALLLGIHMLLGLQYFLVEKYPVKVIAILGPSRYLMFMGWGVAFLYAGILGEFIHSFRISASLLHALENRFVRFSATGMSLLLVVWICIHLDDPKKEKDTPALSWIRNNTAERSTFVSNNWILDEMDIRYIGERAVYIGDCFPFQEDFFKEYHQRSKSVYGMPEQWKGEKNIVLQRLYYFRKMTPGDFVEASERFPLDYVVIDARDSLRFADFTPEYKDSSLRIYSISSFKGQSPNHIPFVTFTE